VLDTLRLAQDLEGAGMARPQAERVAEALNRAVELPLDKRLGTIEGRLAKLEADLARLRDELADVKGDVKLLKWGNGVVLAGIVAILLKLFLPA
jgi:hypothetical protein